METIELKFVRRDFDDGGWDETFYIYGTYIIHNPLGPAYRNSSGLIIYRINDALHNEKGPARIFSNGKTEYWLDGIRYFTKEEYDREISRRNTPARKMSISEIEKELGYKIEIVS